MDKKISELDQALQINNDAVFPISQDNGGTDTTYKVSITQISAEVGEDQTFSTLDTTDKTLVGAINEIAQGGGGGGSSTLAGLNDVDIDDQTLSDGQVLKYDSAEDKWINDDEGAGGHTIVSDDGTDLTQRAKLQFIGAYSEDNSVDDTTEVNVVRNMTRAQFNQLSADEKTGLINITDESLSAAELPIASGSATNTKDYIDSGLSGKASISTPVQNLSCPRCPIQSFDNYKIQRIGNIIHFSVQLTFGNTSESGYAYFTSALVDSADFVMGSFFDDIGDVGYSIYKGLGTSLWIKNSNVGIAGADLKNKTRMFLNLIIFKAT